MAGRECCGSELARWDHDGSPRHHPLRPRPARGGGAETPRRSQSEEAAPPPQGWRPALAVSRYPSLAGLRLMRSLPIWTSPTARDSRSPSRRAGQRTAEIKLPRFGSPGVGNVVRVVFELGGPVDRSFRHRGQVLVVVSALLGAVIGAALGLIVEGAQTSTAVAAGPGRGAALAASPPSSHPPASRTAGSGDGNDSSGNQRAESPDRPDKRHGNAHKSRAGGRDEPGGHGKDNPGKGKDKEVARRLW
jgi:hypothetical protein